MSLTENILFLIDLQGKSQLFCYTFIHILPFLSDFFFYHIITVFLS